jgi:hypothetical protein
VYNYRYEKCGCINPKQWNARSITVPGSEKLILAPLCNISDKCYSQVAYVLSMSPSLLDKYCSYCPQQCSITDFSIMPSMWKAPPAWLMDDIKKSVEHSEIPLPNDWSSNWRSYVDSSYLSVELVHESALVENYTQKETMTAIDVLSNVGGQTGLWIGVSFLSIMELAEMIYRLIRYQYYVVRRTQNRIQDESKV